MINLISLLPVRIWPEGGAEVQLKGINEDEAITLLKEKKFNCYINNPIARLVVSDRLGMKLKKKAGLCPLLKPGKITLSAVIEGLGNLDHSAVLSEAEKGSLELPALKIKWVLVEVSQTEQKPTESEHKQPETAT